MSIISIPSSKSKALVFGLLFLVMIVSGFLGSYALAVSTACDCVAQLKNIIVGCTVGVGLSVGLVVYLNYKWSFL